MSKFFGLADTVSASHVDREAELWGLVKDLQKEKADLCREREMWRDKYLSVTGQGNYSYPQEIPSKELSEPEDIGPLGRHVSIMGLRAKHEIAMREQAKKNAEEKQ